MRAYVLPLLLLSLLLTACASPSPATLTMSGPIVDAATNKPVVADT